MHPLHCLATLAISLPAFAQETYWIANRGSSDIMQVSAWGSVLRRIAMPTTLRSAHVAPDGKVWVVRFIQGTFDIVDPTTGTITPVLSTLGNPFDIAFDSAGNGWVSGGTGVQQFSPAGVLIQAFPLTVLAPLGITIDSLGNKWIAHRVTPASVSRIDPAGVVTNYPLAGVTAQPTDVIADFRGLLVPSRMWVIGDGTAQLVEIDELGNLLNTYSMSPLTALSGLSFDKDGNIWVGSNAAAGTLLKIDRATGLVLGTSAYPPGVIALATDTLGRLMATARTAVAPCEVRRISPATGGLEIPTFLTISGFNATTTQSAISTPFQYSLVVAPFGDMDLDGDPNFSEIQNNTSPIDPASNQAFSVDSTGTTNIGGAVTFNVRTPATTIWVLGFADLLLNPGLPVPGFGGLLLVNPGTLFTTIAGFGPGTVPVAIPFDPGLQGYEMVVQGLTWDGAAAFDFRNASGVKVW